MRSENRGEGENCVKEELYQWIKNLAVFYILLSAAVHLVPDGKYEKYVRFFMGLLLILMMSTPVFSLAGRGRELSDSFRANFARENRLREQEEFANLQEIYLEKGYELELEKKIKASLKKRGIEAAAVKVNIEKESLKAVLYLEKMPTSEEERGIRDGLLEDCEIGEGEYEIEISEYGNHAVGGASSAGASSGSGRPSGIP